jgi:hypothetical protein
MSLRFTIYDLLLCLLLLAGCAEPQATGPAPAVRVAGNGDRQPTVAEGAASNTQPAIHNLQSLEGFGPARISILPLTELAGAGAGAQPVALSVYVSLLDSFGCQIKAPGVVRFEVYQYVPRSAEPKGPRINLWPDVDLTQPAQNNRYWRDFLRAYEFTMNAPTGSAETYILEATFLCPDGRRLSADFVLRPAQ